MKLLQEIIGHNNIVGLLRGAVDRQRVAHAYLFSGPAGVGKKTCAFAFTRALLCQQPRQGDACAQCRSCRQLEAGNYPDFMQLEPAGSFIKIEQVREIQKKVLLTPFQGSRQVCLIEEAESMTAEAANCFLKTLEEPPSGVIFILISARPYALLPTVASRCQQVWFQFLSVSQVSDGLIELMGLSEEEAKLPAALSGGSLGQAVALVADGRFAERRKRVIEMAATLNGATPGEACRLAGSLTGSREEIRTWMDALLLWYRDLLVWQDSGREELIFNQDCLPLLEEQAKNYTASRIIDIMNKVEEAKNRLSSNANVRLVLEVLFMHLNKVNAFCF